MSVAIAVTTVSVLDAKGAPETSVSAQRKRGDSRSHAGSRTSA